jgi:proline iminopeptidase
MVDGLRLTYHVHGSGPVCLAHPGGPGIHWPYLRLPELERHLTMVYVEPVGTGSSDPLPGGNYTMERYAYFVDQLTQRLGADKAFVLGHSHGGFVALQTGLDYPERVAGLIVYDSMAYNGQELGEQAFRNIEAYVAARPAGDPLAEQVLAAWKETTNDHDQELDMLQRLLPVYFKDFEAIEPRLVDWLPTLDLTYDANRQDSAWDIRGRLGEFVVPTLVIVGVADFICPVNSARELADGIPGAELVILNQSGHFGHIEEADAFNDAVLKFTAAH